MSILFLKKLEDWLFYIFLFAIPISIRHIFGYEPFDFTEWTAVYVYVTDLLVLTLFGFWICSKPKIQIKKADWFLISFVIVAGLSITNAKDVQTSIFQWLKLLEGFALYFYVKDYALKRFTLAHAFEVIVLTGAFQSVIAIIQFIKQGSLGLSYLGESVLAPGMTGIAAFYVEGIKIMRAYGTLPHSNVLAIYLFIALGAFYSIAIYQKRRWWWHVLHVLILWAFLLTFSRTIIGLWFIAFIIHLLFIRFYRPFHKEFWQDSEMRKRSLKIFWTTVTVGAIFVSMYGSYVVNRSSISTSDEAVQLRILYNQESLKSVQNWLGLGIGNFVPWLQNQDLHLNRNLYQPVHNVYLLIYSEVGVGLALFIIFLAILLYDFYNRLGFRKLYHFSLGLVVMAILVVGLFDHFLWTIQSGRIVFWLALGLLAGAG
ncbi:MAG: hypothetical protein AAB638_02210 [Patescibacteria group bacterium]